MPFAKLGSTFHWAEVWSKKVTRPTDRPSIHPEKVLDLRSYFPQIFETDQHFSVDFFCKIRYWEILAQFYPTLMAKKCGILVIFLRIEGDFNVNFKAIAIFFETNQHF